MNSESAVPRISVFPKCYFDDLCSGRMDYVQWLRQASKLGAQGAQPEDSFLEIVGRVDSPFFGVQYDPSNATVGGYDPVRFLEKVKHRVVTVHASDRYLAPSATLDDLREADGTIGYSDKLRHGE